MSRLRVLHSRPSPSFVHVYLQISRANQCSVLLLSAFHRMAMNWLLRKCSRWKYQPDFWSEYGNVHGPSRRPFWHSL